MRKIWDIHGGVHPPENKLQSATSPIAVLPLPDELVIPLSQHIGTPALPMVRVGEKVLKGQLIADAQGVFSACVHASTSGEVTAIEQRVIAHPSGMKAMCIVIKPDGKEQWCELHPCEDVASLDHHALVEKIRHAGLAGMGGAGFPTAVKLNPKSVDRVETLILNGTECEPYITADDMLMREHADGVIAGAQILASVVGKPKEILIGVEDNKPEAIAALRQASEGTQVEVVVFPTKYPSGGEKQLIQILTGKELPSGKLPAQIGILVQNVGTAYAAWRAVRYGEPLIERVTTVVGESLKEQRNVRALIGTPVEHLLSQHGFNPRDAARIVIGGPMMGFAVTELQVPVVKTTNCVLAPSRAEMPDAPPAQPCIRCGLCAEACPASLLPQQLYWYAKADDTDRLISHNLFDCIECGACSFVCPSAIPLVQYYRAAKGAIRIAEAEKEKSDRARERFDQRKARIAKAEAEKEAKRQARKKAAEEAKKKLADKAAAQPADTTGADAGGKPDLVAEAIARAKARNTDPAAQRKKLERALSSAQSRIERVQQQLAEADEDKKEKLQAALKQAELKLADARQKLEEFNKSEPSTVSAESKTTVEPNPVKEKLTASPLEAKTKAVATIRKRLAAAETKLTEAREQNTPTVSALEASVEKLQGKLKEAERELAQLEDNPAATQKTEQAEPVMDAAAAAIARAQAKAAESANQSDEQKRQAQIASLKARIEKAQAKLDKAREENSEHLDTIEQSVRKLEDKLQTLESQNA